MQTSNLHLESLLASISSCQARLHSSPPRTNLASESLLQLINESSGLPSSPIPLFTHVSQLFHELRENTLDSMGPPLPTPLHTGFPTTEQQNILNISLANHFLSQRFLETARVFSREAEVDVDLNSAQEGFDALTALKEKNEVVPAIAWLKKYLDENAQKESEVLFRLCGLETSKDILEMTQLFVHQMENRFPNLTKVIQVGRIGLHAKQSVEHLPIKLKSLAVVEVPEELRGNFHTVFVCPVSGEMASNENFPVMLTCGHVFLKDSIGKMVFRKNALKCPTCPQISTLDDVSKVCF